jgi:magnesium transporter
VTTTISHILTYRPKERLALFRSLSLAERSTAISSLSSYMQQQIINELTVDEVVEVLDHLDLLMAEKIVKQIKNHKRREKVIKRLKQDIRQKIDSFVRFHPRATETLVNIHYLYVSSEATISEVGDLIDEHHFETGRFPEILVHTKGELVGYIPITTLVKEKNSAKISSFIKKIATISYATDPSEVLRFLSNTHHQKTVILDDDGSVLGLIYADDIKNLFGQLPAETLYSVSGLDQAELPHDSVIKKFRNRYKWLILNLLTCFMAAGVILFFEDTIDKLALLAVYIPIVAGMGSNVGAQAFAVTLRGLIMGTVTLKNGWPAIRNEIITAALTGALIGLIVSFVSVLLYGNIWLGVVMTISMIFAHIVGGLFGAYIPLLLKRYNVDPAGVTNILLTTATDIFGLFVLLGLGTLLLL